MADLSQLSDDELMSMYKSAGAMPQTAPSSKKTPIYSDKSRSDKAGGRALSVLNGLTFGFGDEIASGALKGASKLGMLDMPVSYGNALETARGIEGGYTDNNPGEALLYNIGGAVATGGAGAATKIGAKLANSLRGGGTAARIGKGALAGAASGSAYGFGSGEGGLENRLGSAVKGGAAGALLGGAVGSLPSAASSLRKGTSNAITGVSARNADEVEVAIEKMHDVASPLYQRMRALDDSLSDGAKTSLITKIDDALRNPEIEYIPELSEKTNKIVGSLRSRAEAGSLGVSTLDQYMRKLSRVAGDPEDKFTAGVVKSTIRNHLDELTEKDLMNGSKEAVELLNQARAASARAFRYEDVAEVIRKANGDPNKIKTGLSNFLLKNGSKYSGEELEALKTAAKSSVPESIMKGLGRFGFEPKNVFMPLVGGATTTALLGGPAGIALTVTGTAARQGQKLLARGKAEKALRALEGNSGAMKPPAKSNLLMKKRQK
jgi:hypothetical protein